ncbi:MAG: NAD-dependent epimerase/dehydratase family protein [Pseudomonadales bacterium]|nr:NAD-dependent epimerase/dehydratase family protein [Pseudomonadales bacterium]
MKVLVTGGNGFVGAAVTRQLLARAGVEVRALIRPGSDLSNLAGLDVELVKGDLNDAESLARALAGCTVLFHVAADYRLWIPDPEPMYRTNVDGTVALMKAAQRAGLERIVYTSSVATLGNNPDRSPADENTPSSLATMVGHYKRSKFLAEAAVTRMAQEEDLPVVIVNPSTPLGPGDIRPTPTGKLIRDAMAGRIPAYVDTGMNFVHVDRVAEGHLLAWQMGETGQRYILGGENLSLQQALTLIAGKVGRRPPRIRMPHGLAMAFALCCEMAVRIMPGQEPLATVEGVKMSRKHMYFSSQKAQTCLGYEPGTAEQAIGAAVEWFR